ncbi:hypothetical protein Q8F55_002831 [Vanrija albida]|uniref:Transglutaminase-like domain-containing protein n=1 Tax=Vanrija albida TaxID=181172 RepID=A0ABR3QBW7_9TREE
MAEDEEPQFKSLKDRIAALNLGAGGTAPLPAQAGASKPRPPPPAPPPVEEPEELPHYIAKRGLPPPKANGAVAPPPTHAARDDKQVNRLTRPTAPKVFPKRPEKPAPTYSYHKEMAPPVRRTTSDGAESPSSPPQARPPLPSRTSTTEAVPSLPPRRPSVDPDTHRPNLPPRKADSTPKLPPRRPSVDPHPDLPARRPSIDPVPAPAARTVPPLPAAKPPLPSSKPPLPTSSKPALPSSAKPALPSSAKPALPASPKPASPAPARKLQWPPTDLNADDVTPDEPLPITPMTDPGAPPPVPLASRPSSKPKPAASQLYAGFHPNPPDCLVCRDFSQPDHYAASYPRASLPAHDAVGYLAEALCDPFPSATDKARAIFTWFHHNVAYDVVTFCAGTMRAMSPEETIRTGLAVCQGYADTFAAIAQRAGLECVVVSGHGKGAGISDWVQGEPIPRFDANHAWNAVHLESGWKLVDACWGAGNIDLAQQTFTSRFQPIHFSMLNNDFGRTHFPADPSRFYVPHPPSWEEYTVGTNGGFPRPTVTGLAAEEGIDQYSIEPTMSPIPLVASDPPSVRFQMTTVCPHWDSVAHGNGAPYLLMLYMPWRPVKEAMVPMEQGGGWWWLDVSIDELARGRGQQVSVVALATLCGRDGRGITADEYNKSLRSWGAWSFNHKGVALWDL